MNNKGFAIVESVVVMAIVFTSFLSIYTFTQMLITSNKVRNKYDLTYNIYKMSTLRTYIYAYGNINDVIKYGNENSNGFVNLVGLKNLNFNGDQNINDQYTNMISDMKISNLYFLQLNYDNKDNPILTNLSVSDSSLYDYIKYTTNKFRNKYRMIAKFENGEYAQIKLWEVTYS